MQKVVGEWYYLNLVSNTGHQPKKSGWNQDGHHPDDHHAENAVNFDNFYILGPGRPSAGGPRMDCRVVTSAGVVKVSQRYMCCLITTPVTSYIYS